MGHAQCAPFTAEQFNTHYPLRITHYGMSRQSSVVTPANYMHARYLSKILILLVLSWMSAASAQERRTEDVSRLAQIRSFGFVKAYVEGTDGASSNDVGLNDADMTKYVRERFAEHFAKIGYAEKSLTAVPELEEPSVGHLWCRIWTVGTSQPIAYYVECRMGSFRAPGIAEQSALGFDKRETIGETVRKSLDSTLAGLAKTFSGTRSGKPRQYVPR